MQMSYLSYNFIFALNLAYTKKHQMKRLFTFIAILFLSLVNSQELKIKDLHEVSFNKDYIYTITFSGSNNYSGALAVDGEGNRIVVGGFDGDDVAFDATHSISSHHNKNIFIAKLNPENQVIWLKNIGNAQVESEIEYADDEGLDVKTDSDNNIYVLANVELRTVNGVNFDPEHTDTPSTLGPTSGFDFNDRGIVLAKYAPDGSLLWLKTLNDSFTDSGLKLHVDTNEHVWVTGFMGGFTGNDIDFDPTQTYTDNRDILDGQFYRLGFIAHYTAEGDFTSVKGIGEGMVSELNIQVAASGNLYVSGSFNATVTSNYPGLTLFMNDANPGYLESQGNYEFVPKNQDIFLLKYTPAGSIAWVKTISSPYENRAYDMRIDAEENVYLAGHFQGNNVDFDTDHSVAEDTKNASASGSAFVAKYESETGTLNWVKTLESSSVSLAHCLTLHKEVLLVGGYFKGQTMLGSLALEAANYSGFLAALDTNGSWLEAEKIANAEFSAVKSLAIDAEERIHFLGFKADLANSFLNIKGLYIGEAGYDRFLNVAQPHEETTSLLYPNPVKNLLHVEHTTAFESLQVYDLLGNLVLAEKHVTTLDVSTLPSGVYILKGIAHNNQNFTERFIKS